MFFPWPKFMIQKLSPGPNPCCKCSSHWQCPHGWCPWFNTPCGTANTSFPWAGRSWAILNSFQAFPQDHFPSHLGKQSCHYLLMLVISDPLFMVCLWCSTGINLKERSWQPGLLIILSLPSNPRRNSHPLMTGPHSSRTYSVCLPQAQEMGEERWIRYNILKDYNLMAKQTPLFQTCCVGIFKLMPLEPFM